MEDSRAKSLAVVSAVALGGTAYAAYLLATGTRKPRANAEVHSGVDLGTAASGSPPFLSARSAQPTGSGSGGEAMDCVLATHKLTRLMPSKRQSLLAVYASPRGRALAAARGHRDGVQADSGGKRGAARDPCEVRGAAIQRDAGPSQGCALFHRLGYVCSQL